MVTVSPGRGRVTGCTSLGTTTDAPHSPQNMAPIGSSAPQFLHFTGSPPDARLAAVCGPLRQQ
jgi:hypothetical protein